MMKMKFITRSACIRLAILGAFLSVFCISSCCMMTNMPGKSYKGPLEPLMDEQSALKDELFNDVSKLAGEIGERSVWHDQKYALAADFIESSFKGAGYNAVRQDYIVEGKTCCNIIAELKGINSPQQIIVIGAHYDSAYGTPGANDNASGTAAVLALAREFAGRQCDKTIRFVAFANEEPPYYHTEQMGSFVYAKQSRDKNENIVVMLSLETIGCYSQEPGSQKYPFPFSLIYPKTGNFIGFVSDMGKSKKLLKQVILSFRQNCKFPSEGGAIPRFIPGASWSDHWSFWQFDYPAVIVTDTAYFRYPEYHKPTDTADKIDYESMARVVSGLDAVIAELAGRERKKQ